MFFAAKTFFLSRVRRAIEDATGVYTGSSMNEEYFYKLGFEGELEQYASGRAIASKNQGIAFVEYTEGMIVLGTGQSSLHTF